MDVLDDAAVLDVFAAYLLELPGARNVDARFRMLVHELREHGEAFGRVYGPARAVELLVAELPDLSQTPALPLPHSSPVHLKEEGLLHVCGVNAVASRLAWKKRPGQWLSVG
ncbi:hypothetical protein PgNI_05721 [Pyricularia grisea]|uniref:Uncharacterized protein n=1 Tax=Pyricularia grisea TaxID=148305 RepID=A0A6P8B6Y3_PYRGI|nr:hypothetical protein PgNI_05721 [Pyricularia grisea]TLD11023.1 hypothetical protein PgNI_05721 [Pyricularia grisea]